MGQNINLTYTCLFSRVTVPPIPLISTEYLQGKHIDQWLSNKPSQAERNQVGQKIFDTFLHCAFQLKAIHADPHIGNYLLLQGNRLALLDFGCIKRLDPSYAENFCRFMSAILTNKIQQIFEAYRQFQLVDTSLSYEEFNTFVQPALAPLQDWISLPYQTNEFDFSTLPLPPVESQKEHKTAVKYFHDIQQDQMYFDRTLFGVYQLLKNIGAVVNTENTWLNKVYSRYF